MLIFLIRILPIITTLLGLLTGVTTMQAVHATQTADGLYGNTGLVEYVTPILTASLTFASLCASVYFGNGSVITKTLDTLANTVRPSENKPAAEANLILLQALQKMIELTREASGNKELPDSISFSWVHAGQPYLFYVGPDKANTTPAA
jgi:hypothetical protein